MTITIHSTTKKVTVNGLPARVWEGETSSGIPIHCFITRVAVKNGLPTEEFEKELAECAPPSVEIEAIPLRFIL
jgi:hypothetical protein